MLVGLKPSLRLSSDPSERRRETRLRFPSLPQDRCTGALARLESPRKRVRALRRSRTSASFPRRPMETAMPYVYEPDNIFAKILRGEAPCVRVFEDNHALAFMDVMPRAEGHALCIPKVPVRNLFDIAPDELARFMPSVRRLALAAKAGLAAEGISVMQFNESAGGQMVFHLHFHILPRWTGVDLRPPGGPFQRAEQLEPIAARIRAAL